MDNGILNPDKHSRTEEPEGDKETKSKKSRPLSGKCFRKPLAVCGTNEDRQSGNWLSPHYNARWINKINRRSIDGDGEDRFKVKVPFLCTAGVDF